MLSTSSSSRGPHRPDIPSPFGRKFQLSVQESDHFVESDVSQQPLLKSEQFISLTALPFHRELQLTNYQNLTQDILFI